MIKGTSLKDWTQEAKENLRTKSRGIEWFAKLDRQLQMEWTYFHTHTFRPQRSIPRHKYLTAGPRLIRWCSGWSTLTGAHKFRLLLWSAEEHKSGLVHLHALSACSPDPLQRHCDECLTTLRLSPEWRTLKESWWLHWGKAKIEPYNPALRFGAERYVTKYVLDEQCLDWGVMVW